MKACVLAIFVLLGAAGCSTQSGGGSAGTPQQVTTRAQASARIHTELAAKYYELGQLGIALEELQTALQSEPDYAPAFNLRGLVRMELREYQQADEDFRHSLRLDSTDAEAHNNYGWFLCQRGKEKDAIAHFIAAVKNPLYQTPEKAYLNAGMCSRKSGNLKDAEDFLNKALRVQPEMPEALLELAEVNFANSDYAAARAYFIRFSQRNPAPLTAEHLWLAVRIERKLGDRKAEERYASDLRQRFPDARETHMLQSRF